VTGTSNLISSFTETSPAGLILTQQLTTAISQLIQYGNGTSAGNVDYVYGKTLTLAGSATTLDLTSLTDLFGGSINFARVRFFAVQNLSTTAAQTVTISGGTSNPWTTGPWGASSTIILQPSPTQNAGVSRVVFEDPYVTGATTGWYTSGTSKTVKLDPGANTISVNVLIAGCSVTS
jgi:hypothetical protein